MLDAIRDRSCSPHGRYVLRIFRQTPVLMASTFMAIITDAVSESDVYVNIEGAEYARGKFVDVSWLAAHFFGVQKMNKAPRRVSDVIYFPQGLPKTSLAARMES